jgi:hypothetical protein
MPAFFTDRSTWAIDGLAPHQHRNPFPFHSDLNAPMHYRFRVSFFPGHFRFCYNAGPTFHA